MSMRIPILLVGAGGHAASCIDVIERHAGYEIVGLLASAEEVGKVRLGYPVIGTEEDLARLLPTCSHAAIGVGQIKSPAARQRLFHSLREKGFELPAIVSPRAHVSRHARVGAGTIVMHDVIVNAAAVVGENCILNSRCLIEHDAAVGDHVHVSTGALVNGAARIGSGSFVGSGACLREGVSIGRNCIVGMGVSVCRDCADDMILK